MPETFGLQTELVQLMSDLYVLLVHPVASVQVQAERKWQNYKKVRSSNKCLKKLPENSKFMFPLTPVKPPNMGDISQVASAGATVVVAGAGAAVVGTVPDPSQAVGAAEKYNSLQTN